MAVKSSANTTIFSPLKYHQLKAYGCIWSSTSVVDVACKIVIESV